MKFIFLALSLFIQLFQQDKTVEQIKVEQTIQEWVKENYTKEPELSFSSFKADYTEEYQLLKMEAATLQNHSIQPVKKETRITPEEKSIKPEKKTTPAEIQLENKLKDYHPKVMSYQIDAAIYFTEDSIIKRRFFLNDYFQITTIREIKD